eukprot:3689443-Amphidinium_carterae.1
MSDSEWLCELHTLTLIKDTLDTWRGVAQSYGDPLLLHRTLCCRHQDRSRRTRRLLKQLSDKTAAPNVLFWDHRRSGIALPSAANLTMLAHRSLE